MQLGTCTDLVFSLGFFHLFITTATPKNNKLGHSHNLTQKMLPPRMLQLQRSSSTLLTHNAATLFPTHRLAPASSRTHPRPLIVARAPWGNTNTNKKQQNQRGSSSGSKPRAAASSTEPATSFRIIIQGRNVTVTPAIKEHLESKLISAVSSFEAVIKEVRSTTLKKPLMEHHPTPSPCHLHRLMSRSRCTAATPPKAHATR